MEAFLTEHWPWLGARYSEVAAALPPFLPPWLVATIAVAVLGWTFAVFAVNTKEDADKVRRAIVGADDSETPSTKQDVEIAREQGAAQAREAEQRDRDAATLATRRHEELLSAVAATAAAASTQTGSAFDPATQEAFGDAARKLLESGGARAESAFRKLADGHTDEALAQLKLLGQDLANARKHQTAREAETWKEIGQIAFPFDTQEARFAYRSALECVPDDAEALIRLGILERRTGNVAEAEKFFNRVLELNVDDTIARAAALSHLGILARHRRDFAKAKEHELDSLKIDEERGNMEGVANSYGSLGNIARSQEQWDEALEWYDKGLAIFERLNDPVGIALCLGNRGTVLMNKGDLDGAERDIEAALKLEKAAGRTDGVAEDLAYLSDIAAARGDKRGAIGFAQQALVLADKIDHRRLRAACHGAIGRLQFELDETPGTALEHLVQAEQLYRSTGDNEAADTFAEVIALFNKSRDGDQ